MILLIISYLTVTFWLLIVLPYIPGTSVLALTASAEGIQSQGNETAADGQSNCFGSEPKQNKHQTGSDQSPCPYTGLPRLDCEGC